ncbi:VOC family protein [Pendulispora brunnea]|uniref:VOC family protein n=1 Tax=Pendulispora brunnea TaxID=2905690 RepID=A0ABZ2JXD7_9BACT
MSLFGKTKMGYAVVESRHLPQWRTLLEEGIGLHVTHAGEDDIAFRLDEHARRIIVRRGDAEDVVATGWQLEDEAALEAVVSRCRARGITVASGSAAAAKERGVASFVTVQGPKGLAIELFTNATRADAPLEMLASGFVTGLGGMGHIALTTRLPDDVERFWGELFDARLSDRVAQRIAGVMVDIAFLRLNERHHSIAIAATRGLRLDPLRTKVQHVNLEAASMDDIERAFARCRQLGFEMAHEIGQHPNDHQISFYVLTPSGFELELGWNARKVDEASWRTASYDAISSWGHKPERSGVAHRLAENAGNFARGLHSLLNPEFAPLRKP